jgi:hypothetical protein
MIQSINAPSVCLNTQMCTVRHSTDDYQFFMRIGDIYKFCDGQP